MSRQRGNGAPALKVRGTLLARRTEISPGLLQEAIRERPDGAPMPSVSLVPTPSEIVLLRGGYFAPAEPPTLWTAPWLRLQSAFPWLRSPEGSLVHPLQGPMPADRDQLIRIVLAAALLADERSGGSRLSLDGGQVLVEPLAQAAAWPPDSVEDRLRRGRAIGVADLVQVWLADGSNHPARRALRLIEHSALLRGLGRKPRGCDDVELTEAARALAASVDLSATEQLLAACSKDRPLLWAALLSDIGSGVERRRVAPSQRLVGTTEVPAYDYREAPIDALDRAASTQAVPAADQPILLHWPVLVPVTMLLVLLTWTVLRRDPAGQDTVFWTSALTALLLIGATTSTRRIVRHHQQVRLRNGLPALSEGQLLQAMYRGVAAPPERMRAGDEWASLAALIALVALLATFTGAGAWLLFGAILLTVLRRRRRVMEALRGEAAREAVAVRLEDSGPTAASGITLAAGPVVTPAAASTTTSTATPAAGSSTTAPSAAPVATAPPWVLQSATELPGPSPELLARMRRRASYLELIQRWQGRSLAVLIAGHLLILTILSMVEAPPAAALLPAFLMGVPMTTVIALMLTAYVLRPRALRAAAPPSDRHRTDPAAGARSAAAEEWPLPAQGPRTPVRAWQVLILFQCLLDLSLSGLWRADQRDLALPVVMLAFLGAHRLGMFVLRRRALAAHPLDWPARLAVLRVFGSPSFDDLVALIEPWRLIGTIEHLEGFDTVGRNEEVLAALEAGDVDRALVKDTARLLPRLDADLLALGPDLRFPRHALQCTSASWRDAVGILLDRADAVVMDLTGLSPERQGCAWELRHLLHHVPLGRVTLLVNDSTDLDCLRAILTDAAAELPASSPNATDPPPRWQLVRIGGLSERQADESYHAWRRRLDQRLDPMALTGLLWQSAQPLRHPAGLAGQRALDIAWRRALP